MFMVKITTILVTPATRDKLKALGTKGETYDKIIQRLIEHFEKTKPKEKRV